MAQSEEMRDQEKPKPGMQKYLEELEAAKSAMEQSISEVKRLKDADPAQRAAKRSALHGTDPQLELLRTVPDEATTVVIQALQTFGSVRKALGWLNDPCGALRGAVPLELILAGQKERVEAELDLIRDGAYV